MTPRNWSPIRHGNIAEIYSSSLLRKDEYPAPASLFTVSRGRFSFRHVGICLFRFHADFVFLPDGGLIGTLSVKYLKQ